MNYDMQGINSQALRNAEIDEGRNREKHQVLMVDKTTSFKKKGKGEKGKSFKKNGKQVVTPVKKPKAKLKPETKCFYCKEMVTRSTLNIWRIRRKTK